MTFAMLKRASLRHRRKIIIASMVLVVLALAAYACWSVSTWNAYKVTYENWQKDLRTSINTAVALPVTTSTERAKKMTAFNTVSNKINVARRSLCYIPAPIAWQHVIGTLHQREEACDQVVSKADAFGKKMQATTTYLEDEQALATIIATALTASQGEVTEATWGSQIATWQDAAKAVTKLPSTEVSFSKVKAGALEKIKSIESAWQELIAAHTAKDKAKYIAAQTKLGAAYGALPSISTASTEQLKTLAVTLQAAYSQAFGLDA